MTLGASACVTGVILPSSLRRTITHPHFIGVRGGPGGDPPRLRIHRGRVGSRPSSVPGDAVRWERWQAPHGAWGQGWGPPCLPWGPPRCHDQSPGPVSASVDGQRPPHRVAVSISGTRPSAPGPRTAARQPAQGHGRGWQGLPDPFRSGVEFEVTADPPGPSDILPPPECRPALDGDAVDQGPSVRTAFVLPSAYETFPFGWSPCTSTLCLHTSMHTHTHV